MSSRSIHLFKSNSTAFEAASFAAPRLNAEEPLFTKVAQGPFANRVERCANGKKQRRREPIIQPGRYVHKVVYELCGVPLSRLNGTTPEFTFKQLRQCFRQPTRAYLTPRTRPTFTRPAPMPCISRSRSLFSVYKLMVAPEVAS